MDKFTTQKARKREKMIISIASLKGGVGKTTIATFLSQAFIRHGDSVTLIDLDHNNNLTDFFLRDSPLEWLETRNIFEALKGKPFQDCVWETPLGPKIIPATPSLSNLDSTLGSDPGLAFRFREDVRELDSDIVIIDIHNAKHLGLFLAIYASDLVLSPFTLNRWTFQGAMDIQAEAEKAQRTLREPVDFLAVRSNLTEKKSIELGSIEGLTMAETTIYRSDAIETAVSLGEFLNPGIKAFRPFEELVKEIIDEP